MMVGYYAAQPGHPFKKAGIQHESIFTSSQNKKPKTKKIRVKRKKYITKDRLCRAPSASALAPTHGGPYLSSGLQQDSSLYC